MAWFFDKAALSGPAVAAVARIARRSLPPAAPGILPMRRGGAAARMGACRA